MVFIEAKDDGRVVFAAGGTRWHVLVTEVRGMALNGLFCVDVLRPLDLLPLTDFICKYHPGWWRWWWQLDYRSYKSCKVPVKSSPPTNQQPVFYRPDALPVAQPTVSKHWRETDHTFHRLAYPKLTWGLPTLSLTNNSSCLPWGGLPCLSSALWCQYPKINYYCSMYIHRVHKK